MNEPPNKGIFGLTIDIAQLQLGIKKKNVKQVFFQPKHTI